MLNCTTFFLRVSSSDKPKISSWTNSVLQLILQVADSMQFCAIQIIQYYRGSLWKADAALALDGRNSDLRALHLLFTQRLIQSQNRNRPRLVQSRAPAGAPPPSVCP